MRDLIDGTTVHHLRRVNRYASACYLSKILPNADRPRCLHAEAERSPAGLLPDPVAEAVETLATQRTEWTTAYRQFQGLDRAVTDRYAARGRRTAERERSRGQGGDGREL